MFLSKMNDFPVTSLLAVSLLNVFHQYSDKFLVSLPGEHWSIWKQSMNTIHEFRGSDVPGTRFWRSPGERIRMKTSTPQLKGIICEKTVSCSSTHMSALLSRSSFCASMSFPSHFQWQGYGMLCFLIHEYECNLPKILNTWDRCIVFMMGNSIWWG